MLAGHELSQIALSRRQACRISDRMISEIEYLHRLPQRDDIKLGNAASSSRGEVNGRTGSEGRGSMIVAACFAQDGRLFLGDEGDGKTM